MQKIQQESNSYIVKNVINKPFGPSFTAASLNREF